MINIKIPKQPIKGEINLAGSKSISNRVLIIRALCEVDFEICRLANAKDTETLKNLLASKSKVLDVGPAGTTFRFLTAFLALQKGSQKLTGSERMKNRPIAVLVESLKSLGADIEYLEKKGFPPLLIKESKPFINNKLVIAANVSSQYISALLLIAPTLENGLELTLKGKIVSRPYIQMTLNLMAYFGIKYDWQAQKIRIEKQQYQAKIFTVEADWSAASYYYAIAAFANADLDLQLNGLFKNSLQGDAIIAEIGEKFGIKSTFNEKGVHLTKVKNHKTEAFKFDFLECPDIAQTVAVICGGLGVKAHFLGLETLKIKETNRVAALNKELKKIKVDFVEQTDKSCKVSGKASFDKIIQFPTYEDHRMAMAFAPLAILHEIIIEEPEVVQKSYPDFWEDLKRLGFEIKKKAIR